MMSVEALRVASELPVAKLAVRWRQHWQTLAGSMLAVAVVVECFQIGGLDRKACLSAP